MLSPDGLSALGLACEAGHVEVVQQLSSHAAVDVNAGNAAGRTPLVAALERSQHECVRVLLQHPSHSLSRAGVRPPYLPPTLKAMVNLYRNNSQVRHALVLSAPPPSLVLDGAVHAGDSCVAGGGEVASVLLSLPRPFQVVQHVLRRACPESLAKQVHSFADKIQPEEGAVVLYISGEILVTPEGPALCLPSAQPAPTNVLLSSLVNALSAAPTLVLLLDAVAVRVDEAASQSARSNPHAHILPPLLHPSMAVVGGASTERLQVVGSRCSAFSAVLAREILHGVTMQQLHQRTNQQLAAAPRTPASSPPPPAILISNLLQDWLF